MATRRQEAAAERTVVRIKRNGAWQAAATVPATVPGYAARVAAWVAKFAAEGFEVETATWAPTEVAA